MTIKNIFNKLIYFNALILVFILSGCLSVIENIGNLLDGSNEKILEHYRSENGIEIYRVINRENEESLLITLNKFPMMKLRGDIPLDDGSIHLTSIEYLAGNSQGWNEYSLAILGEGVFTQDETLSFTLNGNIEPVQIVSGRIQRRDTRITGTEAVTALNNRRERIISLAEWMTSLEAPKTFETQKDFENYWKRFLFPELVSNRKKPEGWRLDTDVFQRAEYIRWNTGYTERTFPEELRPVRDSGTLLRDWEEALPWIHIEYEWEIIVNLLNSRINLIKIK